MESGRGEGTRDKPKIARKNHVRNEITRRMAKELQ